VGFVCASSLSPAALDAYGWRIAFLIGAATLPFGLWIRSRLPETLHETEEHPHQLSSITRGFSVVRENARIIVLGLIVLASFTIGTYVFTYLTTFAQSTLHMTPQVAFGSTVVRNLVVVAATLSGGALSDRIGRRPVMVVGYVAFVILVYPAFYWIVESRTAEALVVGSTVTAALSAVSGGAFYAAFSETLPKRIRGGAFAIVYASAIATFGGTTQPIITWLIHVTSNPLAPAWYLLAASVIGVVATMLILESAPARRIPEAAYVR
jgi:MFS family permease